ncbi:MAG: response regulator transcription factor [Myxococcota bacterium]
MRVLVVEDDRRTAELVRDYLQGEGFTVTLAHRGSEGLAAILTDAPDVVVLDWMLPDLDGLQVCKRARESYAGPILMLTARDDEVDQIVGLEVGADDYLTKPVRPRLLVARLRALLRRTTSSPDGRDPERHEVADWVIDRGRRSVTVRGEVVDLTTAEFDLLWFLAEHAGSPVTRDQLFEELRGIPYDGLDRSMDMRVSQLRRRLVDAHPEGLDPICTVRGTGYQLVSG